MNAEKRKGMCPLCGFQFDLAENYNPGSGATCPGCRAAVVPSMSGEGIAGFADLSVDKAEAAGDSTPAQQRRAAVADTDTDTAED